LRLRALSSAISIVLAFSVLLPTIPARIKKVNPDQEHLTCNHIVAYYHV
jgi:hypothetical protein